MPSARALIIDDRRTNILLLQQLLIIEGLTTFTMSISKHLDSQLHSFNNIDVVFLNLEVPVKESDEVIRAIRNHPNFGNTKVILYSAHVSELHQARNLGFDGLLHKPIHVKIFPEQLKALLKREKINCLM